VPAHARRVDGLRQRGLATSGEKTRHGWPMCGHADAARMGEGGGRERRARAVPSTGIPPGGEAVACLWSSAPPEASEGEFRQWLGVTAHVAGTGSMRSGHPSLNPAVVTERGCSHSPVRSCCLSFSHVPIKTDDHPTGNRPFCEQCPSAAILPVHHTQKLSPTINVRLALCREVSALG
jgi:hypothetical protein